jgi:hypothetical protein
MPGVRPLVCTQAPVKVWRLPDAGLPILSRRQRHNHNKRAKGGGRVISLAMMVLQHHDTRASHLVAIQVPGGQGTHGYGT